MQGLGFWDDASPRHSGSVPMCQGAQPQRGSIYTHITPPDCARAQNNVLDAQEVKNLFRVVNADAPLFSGNFELALSVLDQNADGVVSFAEFVAFHKKYPTVLWPLFNLQDRLQSRTLGRDAWNRIARRMARSRRAG
jgi:hypothetical protein